MLKVILYICICNLTASAIQLIPYINDGHTTGIAAKLCVPVHHPLEKRRGDYFYAQKSD